MAAALELVDVAEGVATGCAQPFTWHNGMVRPAASAKQAMDYIKAAKAAEQVASNTHMDTAASSAAAPNTCTAMNNCVKAATADMTAVPAGMDELQKLVPGLQMPTWTVQELAMVADVSGQKQQQAHTTEEPSQTSAPAPPEPQANQQPAKATSRRAAKRQQKQQQPAVAADPQQLLQHAGLHIPCGVVLDVQKYLHALWSACQVSRFSILISNIRLTLLAYYCWQHMYT